MDCDVNLEEFCFKDEIDRMYTYDLEPYIDMIAFRS